ncbi:MAG: SAM-dependent methyltransferase [Candidatus Lindowbacteria bacterium RIFCSPLOWO2_12_FULL_62_27]|nr:MAG: SAM-dependent methyltransferase [Candidatus Lindowbacteria bacterium RIFCSPLOWO2_12_FULL_62_27]OGH58139.1 MAG: SAM-dependent methyltransferase [Candidatus Lindowbacteria bacterium RIFCSPLOWO2_02_FULL_62_12]
MKKSASLTVLTSPDWTEYELLDSGGGAKLERFGAFRFVRPEPQAVWQKALLAKDWEDTHMVFRERGEDEPAGWETLRPIEARWKMRYKELAFWVQPTPFRHLGVFPEQASHWDWIDRQIRGSGRPVSVLSLFGYTGLATLAAAAAGASVTHVDASKKAMTWARENQILSGLSGRPIRWIVDDAMKFVKREIRRGARYDAFILDPPKFGRGPKGEVWKLEESLPALFESLRDLSASKPLFVILTVYAFRASALSLSNAIDGLARTWGGATEAGELAIIEKSAGRILSTAVFGRHSV